VRAERLQVVREIPVLRVTERATLLADALLEGRAIPQNASRDVFDLATLEEQR
jgi:hypothetical protein